MFAHTCTACAIRRLVFPSQVTSLVNTEHGIVVTYTCWCDAPQQLVTGRAAARPARALVAA